MKSMTGSEIITTAVNLNMVESLTGQEVSPMINGDITKPMTGSEIITTAVNYQLVKEVMSNKIDLLEFKLARIAFGIVGLIGGSMLLVALIMFIRELYRTLFIL